MGDHRQEGAIVGERTTDAVEIDLRDGTPARVVVSGDLDLATGARFLEALEMAIGRGAAVEVDLGDVTFMDSQGIRALCLARRSLAPRQRLVVSDTSVQVQRVLALTGLDTVFGGQP